MTSDADSADEMLRAIRRIVRRVSDHSRFLAREVGLTVPQLLVLRAIGSEDDEELTLARVSASVQLSPATVSRIIDRLERGGLVQRARSASDRRRVCLSLTAAGVDRFHTLPTPLQERFVERWEALTQRQRRTLLRALDKVNEMMDAGELDAAPILAPDLDPKANPG